MSKNCVIWPEDMIVEEKVCTIHQLERDRIGAFGEYNVRGHCFDNFLLFIDGYAQFKIQTERDEDSDAPLGGNIEMTFHEVRRRGQYIDKGGYYLNPKQLKNPRGGKFGRIDFNYNMEDEFQEDDDSEDLDDDD